MTWKIPDRTEACFPQDACSCGAAWPGARTCALPGPSNNYQQQEQRLEDVFQNLLRAALSKGLYLTI
jgi:hypothetical protein